MSELPRFLFRFKKNCKKTPVSFKIPSDTGRTLTLDPVRLC